MVMCLLFFMDSPTASCATNEIDMLCMAGWFNFTYVSQRKMKEDKIQPTTHHVSIFRTRYRIHTRACTPAKVLGFVFWAIISTNFAWFGTDVPK